MANILTITKEDTGESLRKKVAQWKSEPGAAQAGFDAKKFTGKIKSFGDALVYQRTLRDEWH